MYITKARVCLLGFSWHWVTGLFEPALGYTKTFYLSIYFNV